MTAATTVQAALLARSSPTLGSAWPRPLARDATVGGTFAGRANAIGLLRLVFAALVVLDHCFPLAGHGVDPLWHFSHGQESLGGIAVGGFFVLSGFLITRSAERTPLPRYLWHRVLRIFPGFLVCLTVTAFGFAAVAWWHERGSIDGFLTSVPAESPQRYVRMNALLTMKQYNVDGLLASTPYAGSGYPQAFDGSLWTLVYEFKCYLLIGALAVGGVLRRARPVVMALTAGVFVVVLLQSAGVTAVAGFVPQIGGAPSFARFTLYFLLGALFHLFRGRVPLDDRLGVLALATSVLTLHEGGWVAVGTVAFAYTTLWAAVRIPAQRLGTTRDFSYGLYIYGFPVQQLLAEYGFQRHGLASYLLVSLAGAGALAVASWYCVESPALRLKELPRAMGARSAAPEVATARQHRTAAAVDDGHDLVPPTDDPAAVQAVR